MIRKTMLTTVTTVGLLATGVGKGVDHFFAAYGGALFQIFSAAQAR